MCVCIYILWLETHTRAYACAFKKKQVMGDER